MNIPILQKQSERTKAILLAAAAAIGISVLLFGTALAQVSPSETNAPAPVVLDISSDGDVLIRGTVAEVNADTIVVDSWGGTWTVRLDDDGSVISGGTTSTNDASSITVGDFVGAEGRIASDSGFTIDASFVRNWTTDPVDSTTVEDTAGMLSAPVNTVTVPADSGLPVSSTWSGTVEDVIGDDSFTFTDDTNGITYTVDTMDASFSDMDGESIDMDDIDEGDDVTVEGSFDGSVINASNIDLE